MFATNTQRILQCTAITAAFLLAGSLRAAVGFAESMIAGNSGWLASAGLRLLDHTPVWRGWIGAPLMVASALLPAASMHQSPGSDASTLDSTLLASPVLACAQPASQSTIAPVAEPVSSARAVPHATGAITLTVLDRSPGSTLRMPGSTRDLRARPPVFAVMAMHTPHTGRVPISTGSIVRVRCHEWSRTSPG